MSLVGVIPRVQPGEVRKHSFKDYVVRFGFGAAISLVAGLIGLKFGTRAGGVFLGFSRHPPRLAHADPEAGR
ncbi:MAG TPA: hypothetical protein VNF26_03835 [Candidatus Baltobacterales bacterium]|nr:hypothetical protein [Candidatus Baltobacterales bacterium]